MQRRDFVISLASSIALFSNSCKKPEHKIVPAVMPSEVNIPGSELYFNSVYSYLGIPYGIRIKLIDGKPVKIDANPLSDINPNGVSSLIQSSLYSLYNPDRFIKPQLRNQEIEIDNLLMELKDNLKDNKQIHIFYENNNSIVFNKLKELISEKHSNVLFKGNNSYEINEIPYSFFVNLKSKEYNKKTIISLGADLLESSPYSLFFQNCLFDNNDSKTKNFRLLTAEPYPTITGAASDYRMTYSINELEVLAYIIFNLLNDISIVDIQQNIPADYKYLLNSEFITKVRELDCKATYLFCSDYLSDAAQAITKKINGFNHVYRTEVINTNQFTPIDKSSDLILVLNDNLLLNNNLSQLLKDVKPKNKVILTAAGTGNYQNAIIIPKSHYLEQWDVYSFSDSPNLYYQQPVINQLNNDSISHYDLLIKLFLDDTDVRDTYTFIRKYFVQDDVHWESCLRTGLAKFKTKENQPVEKSKSINLVDMINQPVHDVKSGGFRDFSKPHLLSVAYAINAHKIESDNPYLTSLQHNIFKCNYDDFIVISSQTASVNRLKENDLINISIGSINVDVPVIISSGCAFNLFILQVKSNDIIEHLNRDSLLNKISSLKINSVTDNERKLVKHFKNIKINKKIDKYSILELRKLSNRKEKKLVNKTNYNPKFAYKQTKWELAIDLAKCIGCNACVTACQFENNIPIVDRNTSYVNLNMNWLNIRTNIYEFNKQIDIEYIPLMCQHCDNAPCEMVCPVGATSHSPEGVNEMTYNRCVGARYCMINCPYDVRVFNFQSYAEKLKSPLEYMFNPSVTIRERGVAEKCTFCIQRINKHRTERMHHNDSDDELSTACSQVCPTNAITFGNIINDNSRLKKKINKLSTHKFYLLEHLNTKPSVTYFNKFRGNDNN